MTNLEFFSKIYGSDTISILNDHNMKVVSATETSATIEHSHSWNNAPVIFHIECDDAVSMADAFDREAKKWEEGADRFADDVKMYKAVAAEIREALEKRSLVNEQGKMTLKKAEELLMPIITEAVMKETYGKKGVSITPASNDDIISPDSIMRAYNEYRELTEKKSILLKDYETFKSYLASQLYAKYFWEWEADVEAELFACVSEHIETTVEDDEKLVEAWETLKATYNPYDILELGGLTDGIYTDTDAFLNNNTYHINLMFAGSNEWDAGLVSIYGLFMNDGTFKNADEFAVYQDNALSYLIRQQDYTTADIFMAKKSSLSADSKDRIADCKFVQSVIAELGNTSNYINELTFLTSCKGVELADLLDKIVKSEGYIEFPKQTVTGLFSEWTGGGSVLEIELEKSAVFPADMVCNVQLEGAKAWLGEYTVDDVYGLTGSVWNKSTVNLTDTPPVLRDEDFEATRKMLFDAAKKGAEKTNSDIEHW